MTTLLQLASIRASAFTIYLLTYLPGVPATESQCKRKWRPPLQESLWMQKMWSPVFLLVGIRKSIQPVELSTKMLVKLSIGKRLTQVYLEEWPLEWWVLLTLPSGTILWHKWKTSVTAQLFKFLHLQHLQRQFNDTDMSTHKFRYEWKVYINTMSTKKSARSSSTATLTRWPCPPFWVRRSCPC